MRSLQNFLLLTALASVFGMSPWSDAEPVRVRHVEGVTFGFLVLKDMDGKTLAHGELKQVVKPDDPVVMADLRFQFKDGSLYREITKFTQRGVFRLVSDQVVETGPSFKMDSESWVDARTGKITVRTVEKGKKKAVTKKLDLPDDVANGLLFTIVKNLDASQAETVLSMVITSDKPRVVELHVVPGEDKTIHEGPIAYKAQQYVIHIKIPGAAGAIAPVVGKKPPDIHLWVLKSEAPTFIEFEGPLSEDMPAWRIELSAPTSKP
ncbi:MAG TPA: hypothetical protein VL156_09455 [Terriglobales bacterium]|jgi:hypothetical protein|nr:hypothetical protein [Terriglobales bacterium]